MKCYCNFHVSLNGGTVLHTWHKKVHLQKIHMTWQAEDSRSTQ